MFHDPVVAFVVIAVAIFFVRVFWRSSRREKEPTRYELKIKKPLGK